MDTNDDADVPDIDPTEILKITAMRQFELIANDQTNIYVSLVGDSFLILALRAIIPQPPRPTEQVIYLEKRKPRLLD